MSSIILNVLHVLTHLFDLHKNHELDILVIPHFIDKKAETGVYKLLKVTQLASGRAGTQTQAVLTSEPTLTII